MIAVIPIIRARDQSDKLIEKGAYGSKSEMVREALRLLFEKYEVKIWE